MTHARSRIAVALVGALWLTGCSSLGDLQAVSLEGDDFSTALAQEYLEYAQSEAEQGQWFDSEYFAAKGLRASRGESVLPEDPETLDVNDPTRKALARAWLRLTKALGSTVVRGHPHEAARAQMAFDCWAEQADERADPASLSACRSEFLASMRGLEGHVTGPGQAERVEKPGLATEEDIAFPSTHTVYFDHGLARLDQHAKVTVHEVIAHLRSRTSDFIVNLTGHADSSGKERINRMLSVQRANRIKAEMMIHGVPRERILAKGMGESMPAVTTKDGTKEKQNRRVEIEILQ